MGKGNARDLIVVIDVSKSVIAVVGAREYVLKRGVLVVKASALKHFRRVGSDRKRIYLEALPRRLSKIVPHLDIVRVYIYGENSLSQINDLLSALRPALVIVDDGLYSKISYQPKLREGSVRRRDLERLVLIADNVANYFRKLLESKPKKFREELSRFEK